MKIAKQLVVRMNYNTFVRIKASFPATRNESMASYFNRLAVHLEEINPQIFYSWSSKEMKGGKNDRKNN